MRKLTLSAAAVFATVSGSAIAADLPRKAPVVAPAPVPVGNWSGCYVGINGGGAWGRSNLTHTPTGAWIGDNDAPIIAANGSPSLHYSGGEVGGHIGCNYQWNALVIGIEGDGEWMGLKASTSFAAPVGNFGATGVYSQESKVNWLATIRGRLGWTPAPAWLVYATGGVAFGKIAVTQSIFFDPTGETASGSASSTRTGWVAGGGLEYAFSPNWLARIEYLYVDLGSVTATLFNPDSPTFTHQVEADSRFSIVRAGVSYKF